MYDIWKQDKIYSQHLINKWRNILQTEQSLCIPKYIVLKLMTKLVYEK